MAAVDVGSIPEVGRLVKDKIVICKSCKKPEWWRQMRWFNGKCVCRNCYKSQYERRFLKIYVWDDLDGPRPTVEEYNIQEREEKDDGTY